MMSPAGSNSVPIPRRQFFQAGAGLAAAAAVGPFAEEWLADAAESTIDTKTVGIQIGAVSFVDEGTEQVLDLLCNPRAVNSLFLATFTYGRGLAGRQIPGLPFPDHGAQESDEKSFHGGNYATPHAEFYRHTILNQTRAPDHGNLDILQEVLPKAKRRGMKVFCSCEDVWNASVPGVQEVLEEDLYGRKTGGLCLLNPNVRHFWTGLVEDYCRSYDVDGVLFFNERNGPLLNALGASHAQNIASSRVTCFCEYHQKAAHERGIDFQRTREGYRKLDAFVQAALTNQRPPDGYFVEFWRLLVDFPEIILWDKLFDFAKHQVLQDVHDTAKSVRSNLQVGFHIEHVNSFNPIFRATRRYEDLAAKADFLKVVVYNNCGGERYAQSIRNIGATVFRDVPASELLSFNNHLLNYEHEAGLGELASAGLSPDYVARETSRARAGVHGTSKILSGIDIGIPTGKNSRKATPDDTYKAVMSALTAGADGLILSRKYSEMRLANLAAAGRAIREFNR